MFIYRHKWLIILQLRVYHTRPDNVYVFKDRDFRCASLILCAPLNSTMSIIERGVFVRCSVGTSNNTNSYNIKRKYGNV